jgi:hypothetical protein
MNEVLAKLQSCAKGEYEEINITTDEAHELLEWLREECTDSYNDGYDDGVEASEQGDWGYRDWDDHDVEY